MAGMNCIGPLRLAAALQNVAGRVRALAVEDNGRLSPWKTCWQPYSSMCAGHLFCCDIAQPACCEILYRCKSAHSSHMC